jgi:F0F1-type ATP synthase membrane subunit b/b'
MVAVMVFILNRTLLKPVNRILSDREKEIKSGLSAAETLNAERQEKLKEYYQVLKDARGQAYHLLERERAQAITEKEQRVRVAKETIKGNVSKNLEDTRNQQAKVTAELESQAQALGEVISKQVLRSS